MTEKFLTWTDNTVHHSFARFTEHKRSKTARSSLDFSDLKNTGNLTQLQARIIEQQYINKYGLNNLLNQRNSIAPKNWHLYNINK